MIKFISCCLFVFFLFSACNNSTGKTAIKKDVETWMSGLCGRCHEKNDFTHLLELTAELESDKFRSMLSGMIHDNIRLTEMEINGAIDYFNSKQLLKEDDQTE